MKQVDELDHEEFDDYMTGGEYGEPEPASNHKGKCCGQCLWDGIPGKCCCKAIKGENK